MCGCRKNRQHPFLLQWYLSDKEQKSCADAEKNRQGFLTKGIVVVVVFKVMDVFYRGWYEPSSRGNWTQGVQLLLEGGPYHYF